MQVRRCPECGRGWSARGARWCAGCGGSLRGPGRLGQPLDHHTGAAGSDRALHRWGLAALATVGAALIVAAVVTGGGSTTAGQEGPSRADGAPAAGAGTVVLDARSGRSTPDGPSSPGTEPGAAAVAAPGSASPTSGPTCDTEGCALWRSTVLDQRPLLVNGRAAVHLGLDLLVAVDTETGQWQWRRRHDDPRGVSPAAALTASHLDDRTLVIAYGHRLRIHDAETGRVLGEADLAPTEVTDIRRHDDQLVVSGRVRDRQRPRSQGARTRMVGLDDAGRVRFDIEVTRAIRGQASTAPATAPLLAVFDGDLVRFDAALGVERWRQPLHGRQLDGTTLLDRNTGEISVLSTGDGRALLRLVRPGAVAAGVRRGVLIVTFTARIEVYDRDGTAVGEVSVSPERTVVDTAGRQVTVVTLPAAGTTTPQPEVRIGRRAGATRVTLPSVTDTATVPLPDGLDPAPVLAMRRGDGVLVAGPEPGWAWVVDPLNAGVTPIDLLLLPNSEIGHGDGLTIVRNGQHLTVLGAGGSFAVQGVTQVASLDPLVIHGGQGTLRLDRTLVDGRPDEAA